MSRKFCPGSVNPIARDYDFALKITYEMSKVTFSCEDDRRESFKNCFYKTYKMSLNQYTFGSNNITTDGTIFGVLIKPINGKVVFIDYDWVDENGKATYPPFLNLGIPRHHDASPGGRIVKEHDEFMVNRYKH
nr:13002_t:CDS:1 [Entrophospora candida]